MKGCTCVIVLVGAEALSRPWVKYEIEKAWNNRLGVLGVRIHGLKTAWEIDRSPAQIRSMDLTSEALPFPRSRPYTIQSVIAARPSIKTFTTIFRHLSNRQSRSGKDIRKFTLSI
jgi:hypothetical protein